MKVSVWAKGVLVFYAVVGSLGAYLAMGIRTEFDPSALLSYERETTINEGVVVVLIGQGSAGPQAVIRGQHQVATFFEARPEVRSVESLTTTAFPHRLTAFEMSRQRVGGPERPDGEATEQGVESGLLLADLLASDPDRFPLGLSSLDETAHTSTRGPLVLQPLLDRTNLPASDAEAQQALETASEIGPLARQLVGRDRRSLAVVVSLQQSSDAQRLLSSFDTFRRRALNPRLTFFFAGIPVMAGEVQQLLSTEPPRLAVLAGLLSMGLLFVMTRSRTAGWLPMAAAGISIVTVLGTMRVFGMPLNLLSSMVPPLLVTVGLAEGVHMVERFDELFAERTDRHMLSREHIAELAKAVMLHSAKPCLVTTLTTAIGFAILAFQPARAVAQFGWLAGIASLWAYVVTITFVPAALALSRPTLRSQLQGRVSGLIGRLATSAYQKPFVPLFLVTVTVLVALYSASTLRVDSRLSEQLARNGQAASGLSEMERNFDGVRTLTLTPSPRHAASPFDEAQYVRALREFSDSASRLDGVLRSRSLIEFADYAATQLTGQASWWTEYGPRATSMIRLVAGQLGYQSEGHQDELGLQNQPNSQDQPSSQQPSSQNPLGNLIRADGAELSVRDLQFELRVRDFGAQGTLRLVRELRRQARARGLDLVVSGEAYWASRGLIELSGALVGFVSGALIMFGLMGLLFRRFFWAVLAVVPSSLPLLWVIGFMASAGISLSASTAMVFTVTLGLTVDGVTHLIVRMLRLQDEQPPHTPIDEQLVRRAYEQVGLSSFLGALTLVSGFGVLMFSSFPPISAFGGLSALAIAGAWCSQLWLLPALVKVFRRHATRGPRIGESPQT